MGNLQRELGLAAEAMEMIEGTIPMTHLEIFAKLECFSYPRCRPLDGVGQGISVSDTAG
ncbi:Uncharacterised protein [Mycobacteroides abscessus subsp. abscessus]|nr:Uncharacterised protein [Mycobacteroides abscessus subsp. abscessus]